MRALAAAMLLALTGCYAHQELDTNAPGLADLAREPTARLEMPRDPGLQGVVVAGGLFGGGGPEFGGPSPVGAGTLGFELTAERFTSDVGVVDLDHLPPLDGLNLGFTLLGPERAKRQLYLELQHVDRLLGAAAGWTWNPWTNANGPQATLFYGPVYARFDYALGLGATVQFGLMLKGYDRVTWFQ